MTIGPEDIHCTYMTIDPGDQTHIYSQSTQTRHAYKYVYWACRPYMDICPQARYIYAHRVYGPYLHICKQDLQAIHTYVPLGSIGHTYIICPQGLWAIHTYMSIGSVDQTYIYVNRAYMPYIHICLYSAQSRHTQVPIGALDHAYIIIWPYRLQIIHTYIPIVPMGRHTLYFHWAYRPYIHVHIYLWGLCAICTYMHIAPINHAYMSIGPLEQKFAHMAFWPDIHMCPNCLQTIDTLYVHR